MTIIVTNEVRDIIGMGCAINNPEASQRKGKWQDQLQWDLMRQTPTWHNNEWEAGTDSSDAGAIYLSNEKKVYEYPTPTEIRSLSRFMLGEKRIMGVVRRQAEAMTVDQLLLIDDITEED